MDPLLTVAAVTMVGVVIFGGFMLYNEVTEIQPKADIQSKMIQTLECNEVLSFPSSTPLYSKENRMLLNEKTKTCNEARQLAAQKEKERLDALLADPNSYESLSREYIKLTESLPEMQSKYDALQNETSILHEKIANATTLLSQVKEKMTQPQYIASALKTVEIPRESIEGDIHYDRVDREKRYWATLADINLLGDGSVKITFNDKVTTPEGVFQIPEFEFAAVIQKGQTFVPYCDDRNGTKIHVLKYDGITTENGTDWHVFWHKGVDFKNFLGCQYPEIIQSSLGIDFDLGEPPWQHIWGHDWEQ